MESKKKLVALKGAGFPFLLFPFSYIYLYIFYIFNS